MIHLGVACGVSMVAHMVVLVAMGMMLIATVAQTQVTEIVAEVEEPPEEVLTQVLEEEIKPSKELALVSTAISSQVGAMGAVSALSQPQMATQTAVSDVSTEVTVEVGDVNVFKSNGKTLSQDLPEGQLGEAAAIADTYAEAMDRMTQEILAKLAKGKVLVVWAMDQSESMNDDREEILSRIDRVYQELGIASSAKGDALATAVTSYGKDFAVHTRRPTSNTTEIMDAMRAVPNDPSGIEMQCQAIGQAIQTFRGQAQTGQRQMMLIVVTDESGDPTSNVQYLESTIAEAKAARCPIYVLGREAVFGYPYAYMTWTDPKKPEWGTFYLQIERGPETPFPEQLQWDGFRKRNDAHPAGFGPYEQARMARQTGGVFFMLPSPEVRLLHRSNAKYALEAMRPYLPDLSARSDYVAERDKFEMRAIIWKIINDLNPWNTALARKLEPQGTFSIDKAEFAKAAATEMQEAKQIIVYLQEAEKALERIKPLRARESSPRWRANFDMIYGQVLAYQVRLYEYGARLQLQTVNPKPIKNILGPKRPTNYWGIANTNKTITDEITKEKRELAQQVLQQIIAEHSGTPFATRAEWELKRSFGIDLNEGYLDPRLRNPGTPRPNVPKL
ncbi:MAG: VWA domain-containing protein [Planctomycetaceae bacterium]|nr:VWA domain-containing protein [Planctomycetaceae bacterium]